MLLVTTCTFSCRKPFKKPRKSFIKISLDENDDYVILVSSLNQFPLCYVNRCCNIQCRLSGVTCLNDFFSKTNYNKIWHIYPQVATVISFFVCWVFSVFLFMIKSLKNFFPRELLLNFTRLFLFGKKN